MSNNSKLLSRLKALKKFILIIILLLLAIAFFYTDLAYQLNFEALKNNHKMLIELKKNNMFLMTIYFSVFYIFIVACSIPGATILTLLSGFLFGIYLGSIIVVISATIGACIIYLAINLAFRDFFKHHAAKWLLLTEAGFKKNAFSYLLILRFIPLFPFWLVNIIPAILGVRLATFIMATALGIIPGTTLYVIIGNNLGGLLAKNTPPDLNIIFTPKFLIPILALAFISILPVIYKKIKGRKS